MLTKVMKWISIVLLLLAGLRLPTTGNQVMLEIVVCVSGLLAVMQAVRTSHYSWAAGFLAIAVLFNPIVNLGISGKTLLWLDWACLATFLLSLAAWKRRPTASRASIDAGTGGKQVTIKPATFPVPEGYGKCKGITHGRQRQTRRHPDQNPVLFECLGDG